MSHANAALTPRARLRLARLIVEEGWPVALAARRYDVSWPTAKRWAARYAAMGADGMADRSSTTVALRLGVLVGGSGIVWRGVGVVVAGWSGAGCARLREWSPRSVG